MLATRVSQRPLISILFPVAALLCWVVLVGTPSAAADQGTKLYGKVKEPPVSLKDVICPPSYTNCQNGVLWQCTRTLSHFGCSHARCVNTHNPC